MTAALAVTAPASAPPGPLPRPALRMVVRPAPPREPPFDDELAEPIAIRPYDEPLPFDGPPLPPPRVVAPLRPQGLPDPGSWARRLLVGLIETADGRRPLQQLAAMLSGSVGRGLGADFEKAAQLGSPHWLHRAGVLSVRSSEPVAGVAELCATVETGQRVRAIAMRLEAQHGRWRCTRLQLG